MLDGLPRGFQQHAVLRVHRGGLALVDTEEVGVEPRDVVDESAPTRHRAAGHPGFGVEGLVGIPSFGWNLGDEVGALQQRLPQLVRRVDPTRQSAGHPDYCDRGDRCLTHVRSSSLFINTGQGNGPDHVSKQSNQRCQRDR